MESSRLPDTTDTTPRDDLTERALGGTTAHHEKRQDEETEIEEEKAVPLERPQSKDRGPKAGKPLRPPPSADSLPSIISKQSKQEEQPLSSGRVKDGALLHVILSDDVEEVGIDEVDEIQERRRQQLSFQQRQMTPSNSLAPPQLEHELLMQKLDTLAASSSDGDNGRSTLHLLPSTVIIPPTPLTPLERATSSHSLLSNTSRSHSGYSSSKTSTSRGADN